MRVGNTVFSADRITPPEAFIFIISIFAVTFAYVA
ncbi:hypothetical protein Metlim_1397 [Methanoplanus limicola DSM 2279]|uniref:Uncharacterized protein n=1 Tax=Methanoplanus limicola DSM 2279 TaxID=937775 RepID=H1Z2H7_9EURY|nr:hypothetical protein Metlim_1397 [Methanoplanus limicola DSM 2279]